MKEKQEYIYIKGARANNLKGIDVKIPRGKLVVVSGLSGSGKSSLAFDTLFAEGQRRFAESLSSFARQFLGRMQKPAVDKIEGIPPAIAIEQKVNTRNPRSTVGTTTEIYDYLRLLFARIGRTYSPVTGEEVKCHTANDVLEFIGNIKNPGPDNITAYILAEIDWVGNGNKVEKLLSVKDAGYARLFSQGKGMVRLDTVLQDVEGFAGEKLYIMVDRYLVAAAAEAVGGMGRISEEDVTRLLDSVQIAFNEGQGHIVVAVQQGRAAQVQMHEFSNVFEADGLRFEKPTELMFSYNNPIGACPVCGGYGSMIGIDESLVVPNASLSVYEGAIACWRGEVMGKFLKEFIMCAHKFDFPIHKPYAELTKEQKRLLWNGNSMFTGITPFFEMVESMRYKIQYKYLLARYSGKTVCRECEGSRLRKETNYVKIGGKTITELMDMSITALNAFFNGLELDKYDAAVAERAIKEICSRLNYIENVGLGYLTLSRHANTLSGGESQRINLVSSLGSSLVGSLYILDEPSIGLHQRDTGRLINVIKDLRDLGNTVLIVEHDEEIIRSADELIDIGPYAGVNGGEVVYQGPVEEGIRAALKGRKKGDDTTSGSLTIDYLSGIKKMDFPSRKRTWKYSVEICGAMEHNLKNVSVKFPLGVITAVTGVSGSGKSTLIGDTLYPALARHFQQFGLKPGAFKELKGDLGKLSGVEFVDQNPIGKSSRSNPVTYLKIYDDIRKLYSEQQFAKVNGFGHSHFSFNIDGGRCPQCLGEGFITIPMQFMADIKMVCEECGGKRFKPAVLEVKYQGKSINEVLDMSVEEAIAFFGSQKEAAAKKIAQKLQILDDVGLGYVQLGQSSSSLSGGESQRVKLAQFLSKESGGKGGVTGPALFIFDEPTTGLHFHDIKKLLAAFNALVDKGHTIIVVEHNPDVIKAADWEIELGPEGGDAGGVVCYEGVPRNL
ncbi:MAG: excinuclease ABC subunit UvrA [Bacteroidales bacterium]|nr:excinuclease ABC subunit UvrA [Bacteroidales bacterium]